jgi:penicillin-binding protein 1A
VGISNVIEVAHRFGVTSNIPAYLPVALGAVEITLEEQVASYSVFPNDGIRVTPRLIKKVSNADGITLWEEPPAVNEVIAQQTARTMMTLLRAVTAHGTGQAAAQLNHPLGGKTGTTSDYTDAWFLGFSPSVTCGVWVGFDSRESLGEKETGAKAALPIWMNWMRAAIVGKDDEKFLGDETESPALKASTEAAARPGSTALPLAKTGTTGGAGTLPAAPRATGSAAKPLNVNLPARQPAKPASPGPAARALAQPGRPSAQPASKPNAPPTASAPAGRPLIKPALPVQLAPVQPQGAVKPALNPAPAPNQPKKKQ